MKRMAASLAFALTMAACAGAPPPAATPAADTAAPDGSPAAETDGLPSTANDTCGARLFAELIGKPINGQGVPGESRLNRHILPNSKVTMDYVPQRTNFRADGGGIIREITCG
jgi:hypothetical protein